METIKDRIFLVDDDKELLLTYADNLSENYKVEVYESPLQVLNELRKGNIPSLIISDYQMPEMNGLQLSKQIKEKGYFTPVVLISGYMDKDLSVRACNAGVFGIIEKPFEDEELEKLIGNALTAHHMYERNQAFKATAEEFIKYSTELLQQYKNRYMDAERLLKELGLLAVPLEDQLKRVVGTSDLEKKMMELVEKLKELNQKDVTATFVGKKAS